MLHTRVHAYLYSILLYCPMKLRIAVHRYDNCAIKAADGLLPVPDSESESVLEITF